MSRRRRLFSRTRSWLNSVKKSQSTIYKHYKSDGLVGNKYQSAILSVWLWKNYDKYRKMYNLSDNNNYIVEKFLDEFLYSRSQRILRRKNR